MSLLVSSDHTLVVGKEFNGNTICTSLELYYLNVVDESSISYPYFDSAFIDKNKISDFLYILFGKSLKLIFNEHFARLINAKLKSYAIDANRSYITLLDLAAMLNIYYKKIVTIEGTVNSDLVSIFRDLVLGIGYCSSRMRNFCIHPLVVTLIMLQAPI
jgi:hypothetical protein